MRRWSATAATVLLVMAAVVIGGSVTGGPAAPAAAAATPTVAGAGHAGSDTHAPSCEITANCGGAGALGAAAVIVTATACGLRSGVARPPTTRRHQPAPAGRLPAGVPSSPFHPPQAA